MEQPSPESSNVPLFAPTRQERTWAMLAHVLALPAVWFPFGHILAPLIIWLVKRDEMPFVNEQGKEALNFQISVTVYAFICGVLSYVCVGYFLMIALGVAWFVLCILAMVRANDGVAYRYPLTIRLIR